MEDLMKTTQLLIESELRNEELKRNLEGHQIKFRKDFDNLENENSKLKNQVEYYIQLLHIDQVVAQTKEKYN